MIVNLYRRFRGIFGPMPVFGKLHDLTQKPYRGSPESAGLDLYSVQDAVIPPGHTVVVPTGLNCRFSIGWVALIWDRSGHGVRGLHRFAGVIDSDYRGEWGVVIYNSTTDTVMLKAGERVAQVIFQRCWLGKVKMGRVRNDTKRGTGGFGSTGSK